MNLYILIYTEVLRVVKEHIVKTFILSIQWDTLFHIFCLIASALKVAVLRSYSQSTDSRCNITRSTLTRHIIITPLYHPIISHTPTPHPPSVFSEHLPEQLRHTFQTSVWVLPYYFLHKITYVFVVSIRFARPHHRKILDFSPVIQ